MKPPPRGDLVVIAVIAARDDVRPRLLEEFFKVRRAFFEYTYHHPLDDACMLFSSLSFSENGDPMAIEVRTLVGLNVNHVIEVLEFVIGYAAV